MRTFRPAVMRSMHEIAALKSEQSAHWLGSVSRVRDGQPAADGYRPEPSRNIIPDAAAAIWSHGIGGLDFDGPARSAGMRRAARDFSFLKPSEYARGISNVNRVSSGVVQHNGRRPIAAWR